MAKTVSSTRLLRLSFLTFLVALHLVHALPLDAPSTALEGITPRNNNGNSRNAFDWILSVDHLNQSSFTAQPYVSNGYIGSRLPAVGVGYKEFPALSNNPEENGQGWPIFGPRRTATMVAAFYDVQNSTLGTNFPQNGGEQVVSLLPSWTSLFLTLRSSDGTEATFAPGIDNATVTKYKQTMSIRDGLVNTLVTWHPNGFSPVRVNYTVLAHRDRPNVGMMRLQVHDVPANTSVVVTDTLDGQGAQRTKNHTAGKVDNEQDMIYSSVQPDGVNNVTAWMFSGYQQTKESSEKLKSVSLPNSVGQVIATNDSATATQSYEFQTGYVDVYKVVGIATSDAYSNQAKKIALTAAKSARKTGYFTLLYEHKCAWETIWNEGGDIILYGQDEMTKRLQTQARASLFHLLSNVRQGKEGPGLGDNSIAPSGLTSDSYAGSIFWDAETFMAPSLLLLFPQYIESINNYRFKRPFQTIANAQQHDRPGALYPWVSARFQNETGIGPTYDYEYHLNNDIALLHWQTYQHTQNKTFLEKQAYPIMYRAATFWAAQVVKQEDGQYHALNMTDPDEYANHVDDGAFTNAGIATLLDDTMEVAKILGKQSQIGKNWSAIAKGITITQANPSQITLEYDGFNGTVEVKQADVPLLIYPLEFANHYPEKQPSPAADLEYHSTATSSNGPGMTYSIYGIASAELSTSGCESYTRLLQAGTPYEREFAQFSEQVVDVYADNGGTNPAYTFLTGHGGLLQMWTHGFTGHRSRTNSLYLDPTLPPQLAPGIAIKGMRYGQSTVDVEITLETTKIHHRSGHSSLPVEISHRNKKAGNYTVSVGRTLEVPTRTVYNVGNNLAQCKKISASQPARGGNYLNGVNDGSNATYFEPQTDQSTDIIVDLQSQHSIKQVHINFADLPAKTLSLSTSNDNKTFTSRADNVAVNITSAYSEQDASLVLIRTPNITDVILDSIKARYVKLTVEGTQALQNNGTGCHIAEIVVTVSTLETLL